jgi:TonB family protein
MTDTHPAEGVTRPQVISKTDPPYTKEAKDAKVQGTVILRITVDANGNVTDAEVEKGLDKGLDENAVNTLKTWKFKPATKNGKPVSSKLSVEVSFKFF